MRRAVKVVVWVVVFAACVVTGAVVAAHTNPFPPGVEDPGARPTATAPSSPESRGERFTGLATARTFHNLFVGGRCATAWLITLRFEVDEAEHIDGTGVARLRGDLRCEIPIAQVQSRRLDLAVGGRRHGDVLDLMLSVAVRDPLGSDDYGGLIATLSRFPDITLEGGRGKPMRSRRLTTETRVPTGPPITST